MRRACSVAAVALAVHLATGAALAGWFGEASPIPDVVLVDTRGTRWPLRSLVADRPVLLSFFFTGCGSLCPVQTATMQGVRETLRQRRVAPEEMPLMVSVSLDPLGDTPDQIEFYAARFGIELGRDAGWLMLNGSPTDLGKVRAAFDEPSGLPTDHTGFLWLWEPGIRHWSRLAALGEPVRIADRLLARSGTR